MKIRMSLLGEMTGGENDGKPLGFVAEVDPFPLIELMERIQHFVFTYATPVEPSDPTKLIPLKVTHVEIGNVDAGGAMFEIPAVWKAQINLIRRHFEDVMEKIKQEKESVK